LLLLLLLVLLRDHHVMCGDLYCCWDLQPLLFLLPLLL
jgi:hypothetical protein